MRSRKPKPTHDLTPSTITTNPPEWMNAHAAEVWSKTTAALEAEGRPLHRLNLQVFVAFCEAAGTIRKTGEILDREGLVINGGREGQKRHPAVGMRTSAMTALRGLADSLGLSPASSGRLPPAPPPADPWLEDLRRNPTQAYLDHVARHGREPDNEYFEF